jgi:Arc/MetJ-type ribon-helix-helix transcriptional regulator
MIIHLPEKLEASVRGAVGRGHFATLDEAIAQAVSLLLQQLEQGQAIAARPPADERPEAEHKPIWEKFREIAASIPEEVWDRIPADSSEQLDHYLYGAPKRPAR